MFRFNYKLSMVKQRETSLLDLLQGTYILSLDDKMSSTLMYEFNNTPS